jgi:hypothetical protein
MPRRLHLAKSNVVNLPRPREVGSDFVANVSKAVVEAARAAGVLSLGFRVRQESQDLKTRNVCLSEFAGRNLVRR